MWQYTRTHAHTHTQVHKGWANIALLARIGTGEQPCQLLAASFCLLLLLFSLLKWKLAKSFRCTRMKVLACVCECVCECVWIQRQNVQAYLSFVWMATMAMAKRRNYGKMANSKNKVTQFQLQINAQHWQCQMAAALYMLQIYYGQ